MKTWKLNNNNIFFFTGVIILFVLLQYGISYYPLYKNAQIAPVDVIYLGTTEYPIDIYGNLSTIGDGILGQWVRVSKITTGIPALNASFIKSEYLIPGHIARLFGQRDTFTIFYIYRTILSGIVIAIVFIVCTNVIKKSFFRILAFFLSLFSAGITRMGEPGQIWDMMFGDGVVFGRLTTAMPHYLIGIICSLMIIYLFNQWIRQKIKWLLLATVITTVIGSFVNITSVALSIGSTCIVVLWMIHRKKIFLLNGIFWIIPISISFILPSVYLMHVGKYWDFSMFAQTEKLWQVHFTPALYIDAVGLVYLLSFLSISGIFKRGKPGEWVLLLWIVLHPFMVFIGSILLHFNPIRMFYVPYYVVFSVLTAMGLRDVFDYIKRFNLHIARGVVGLAVVAVVWSSWGTYQLYYVKSLIPYGNYRFPYPYGSPLKTVYSAMEWLRDNTQRESVLSGFHSGTMIPGIAGNYVYISWWLYLSGDERMGPILEKGLRFWYQNYTDGEARDFLAKNKIKYIFYGPEEKASPGISDPGLRYSFLEPVYKNSDVTIYRVR